MEKFNSFQDHLQKEPMKNFHPFQVQDLLPKDQGGCCLCCALRCNPGWVKENYPDYYNENYHQIHMMGYVDPMMDPMYQMYQMKMMNPMNNQMNQMIMTQMNQMNQIKNNSPDLNKDSNENILNQEINVLFNHNNSESIPLNTIQCTLSDKVSDIIQKYRNKTLDKETTDIFVYNGKALDLNMTASEAGLNNQAIINVITTKNVSGA